MRSAGARSGCRRLPARARSGTSRVESRVPQRLLGSGAAQPKARGQAGGPVAQSLGAAGVAGGGEPGEHGSAQPAVDEAGHVAGNLQLVGRPLRRTSAAPGAPPASSIPPVAPRRTQRWRASSGPGGHVEGDPGAERVAEQVAASRRPAPPRTASATSAAVAGRSARTRPTRRGRAGPPPPGCAPRPGARRSEPQRRPVWVNPCSRPAVAPGPADLDLEWHGR